MTKKMKPSQTSKTPDTPASTAPSDISKPAEIFDAIEPSDTAESALASEESTQNTPESTPSTSDSSKTSRKGKAQTAWHPLFAELLNVYLPPGYRLLSEYQLTREPQRIDVVVWEEQSEGGNFIGLPAFMTRLTPRNLFEFKSSKDLLERGDLSVLTGYAMQYHVLERGFPLHQLSLFLVASKLTKDFLAGFTDWGMSLEQVEPGIHRCMGLPWRLWCIESDLVWQTQDNQPLGFFTEMFVDSPATMAHIAGLPKYLYPWIVQHKAEFRERSRIMPLSHKEEFIQTIQVFWQEYLASLSMEERLRGASTEEILHAIPMEERLKGVTTEERLKGVTTEEILHAISVEEILHAIPAEERLKGVPAEERLNDLPADERKALLKKLLADEERKV